MVEDRHAGPWAADSLELPGKVEVAFFDGKLTGSDCCVCP